MNTRSILIIWLLTSVSVPALAQSVACDAALASEPAKAERCLAKVDKALCKDCKAGWVHQCHMSDSAVPVWAPVRACLRGELRMAEAGSDAAHAMAGLVRSQSNMLGRADDIAARNERDYEKNRQMVAGIVSRSEVDVAQRQAMFDRIKQEKHERETRELAEMQAYQQARKAEVDALNAQEEARRAQWLAAQKAQQEENIRNQQQEQMQVRKSQQSQVGKQAPQRGYARNSSPAPIVASSVSHGFSTGGINGRTDYISINIKNTGNVPIDCDVWLRAAFWNDKWGPAMADRDKYLSSIRVERGHVIGLEPGATKSAITTSHYVHGSGFKYGAENCRVSFTYRPK
ncbi:hypothetical protein [Pseudoxanthomonas mexicana]